MNVLAIDVGGTNVKLLASGHEKRRKFPSGPKMTAKLMVDEARKVTADWKHDVVSIGYPGPVLDGRILAEPHNLGKGWAGFNFDKAFNCPVKVINDAAMQALGSYKGGRMLFLGLGTGMGSAMIIDGSLQPMELAHLPYRKGTYEDYVGLRGIERFGKKKWQKHVFDVVEKLTAALEPDDVVLGGGNVKLLKALPPKCRAGNNANAFIGGFRMWDDPAALAEHIATPPVSISTSRARGEKKKSAKK
jgi:polyphosphate glucokinase